jgi:hypothetical protein
MRKPMRFTGSFLGLAFLLSPGVLGAEGLAGRVTRLETQVADLQRRLAGLEAAAQPVFLTVNCAAGKTVAAALAAAAGKTGPLTITVDGVCTEAVVLLRNNVQLRAASPGSGLRAPAPGSTVVLLQGVRGVTLQGLTLSGGAQGLYATAGSTFEASGLSIENSAENGVHLDRGSSGTLAGVAIHDGGGVGILADTGASLIVSGGAIERGSWGLDADRVSHVTLRGTAIRDQTGVGAFAGLGSSLYAEAVTVEGCDTGIQIGQGGSLDLNGGTIRDNLRLGIALHGSAASLYGGAAVTGNDGVGVGLFNGARLAVADAVVENTTGAPGWGLLLLGGASVRSERLVVRGNSGDGINMHDASVLETGTGLQVLNNGGWGILCAPSPAVAQISGTPGPVSGNTAGQINCPGLLVP